MKIMVGLGAAVLPWTTWPGRLGEAIGYLAGRTAESLRPPVEPVSAPPVKPASAPPVKTEHSTEGNAMDDIMFMAGPEAQGRRAGSSGEAKVATYLMSQLSTLGLIPLGENGRYSQPFTTPPVIETVINGRLTFRPGNPGELRTPCVNVLGGMGGQNPEEKVMLSAHYDHLGIFDGHLYPGANDNASGVGCVLDVMRRLVAEGQTPRRSIVIAFWSAEEMGFLGSNFFVQHPTFPLGQISAVINADTVGNGIIGNFALWANGANVAVQAIQQAAAKAKAKAVLTPSGGHNSDQISFAQAGIPAVTLMTREWLVDNHTPEDTMAIIKPEQVKLAGEIMYQAVKSLAY